MYIFTPPLPAAEQSSPASLRDDGGHVDAVAVPSGDAHGARDVGDPDRGVRGDQPARDGSAPAPPPRAGEGGNEEEQD